MLFATITSLFYATATVFQTTDPVVWVTTDHQVVIGATEYTVALALQDGCTLFSNSTWKNGQEFCSSTYNEQVLGKSARCARRAWAYQVKA